MGVPTKLKFYERTVGYMLNFIDQQTLAIIALGILINPLFMLFKTMVIGSFFDLERNFENRINRYKVLKTDFLVERGAKELFIKIVIPYSMVLDMLITCYQAGEFMKENPNTDTLDWLISDMKQKLAAN